MQIYYCDACHARIPNSEFEAQTAVMVGEGKAYCAKCTPAVKPGRKTGPVRLPDSAAVAAATSDSRSSRTGLRPVTRSPQSGSHTAPARSGTSASRITASDPELELEILPGPEDAPKPNRLPLYIGAGGAVLFLLGILVVMRGGDGEESRRSAAVADKDAAAGARDATPATVLAPDPSTKEKEPARTTRPLPSWMTTEPASKAAPERATVATTTGETKPPVGVGMDGTRKANPDAANGATAAVPTSKDGPVEVSKAPGETIWADDALPAGATGDGTYKAESWKWVSQPDPVHSGLRSHTFRLGEGRKSEGVQQHSFQGADPPLLVSPADVLFAYVYLDPANPPKEVMMQWNFRGTWEHRAYWGEDLIALGSNFSPSRLSMGNLPKTGQWVRLEVKGGEIGIEADNEPVTGWSFDCFGGTVYWDRAGLARRSNAGGDNLAYGKPVSVSTGSETGHTPDKAVDGNTQRESAWFADKTPCWLEVDLQRTERLEAVHVFLYPDGVRYYQYTVDVSVDGKDYKKVADMSGATAPVTPEGALHKFPAVEARYVRVTILRNSANPSAHLVEVKAYAQGKAPSSPAPVSSVAAVGVQPASGKDTVAAGQFDSVCKLLWKDFQGGGECHGFGGKDKSSKAIWGKRSTRHTLTATFTLKPDFYDTGVLVVWSFREGRPDPANITYVINGQEVYTGKDTSTKLNDWSEQRYPIPAGILRGGQNDIRLSNLNDTNPENAFWYMINSVEILASTRREFTPIVSEAKRGAIQAFERTFDQLAKKDADPATKIDQALRLAKSVNAPELQPLAAVLEKAQALYNQAVANLTKQPPAEQVHVEKMKLTGTIARITGTKAYIRSQGIEMPVDITSLPPELFLKALAFDDSKPESVADKAAYMFGLGNLEASQGLLKRLKKDNVPAWTTLYDRRAELERLVKFETAVAGVESAIKSGKGAQALTMLDTMKKDYADLIAVNKERVDYLTTVAEGPKK